jgi:uncharacterized protein (DUF1330 family)
MRSFPREDRPMSAYVIVEVDVHDPVAYENYKRQTPESITKYGGRFVIRGGKAETLEGDWVPKRIVVVEFESMEQAKRWWNSPEYAPVRALRWQTAESRMIVVEGA